jgi:hypothetical protein
MEEGRHRLAQRQAIVANSRVNMLRIGNTALDQHHSGQAGSFRAQIEAANRFRREFNCYLRQPPGDFVFGQLNRGMRIQFSQARGEAKAHHQMRVRAEARDLCRWSRHI